MTEKTVAKHLHISPNSVQRIEYDAIYEGGQYKYQYNFKQQLPEAISMDEFRSANDQFSFIWCDATSIKQFEVLPNRLTKTIKQYFLGFSLANRKRVKHVVMDMNAQYASFIKFLFPNAEIIIDGFHIAQRIGNALDSVRKNIQKRIDDKQNNRAYKIMKSQWKIFHMMYEDLEKTKPYYMRGINEYLTQEQAIGIVFDEYPEFGQVWTAYQEIMKAMHNKDLSGFEDIITHYTIMGNDMDSAISTFAKNYKGIQNSITSNYSNGRVEGMNHKIKQLKRNSCGYKNMAHLLWRIRQIF
ncbi:ISL3 family transposase [Periweissella cryptocerci]|uniref:ISL3 family transposase n=1 Tax=Periweissella cryptocerci TaxID=2506420 RepID=A0A4P6YWV3_9LACO|nr:ISL3 family transposase [Periweissella cryptocerci]